MLWLVFGLLSAMGHASMSAVSKKALTHVDEYTAAFARNFFAIPFLLLALSTFGFAKLNLDFWKALAIIIPLNLISFPLFMRSVNLSELSIVIPLLSLTPVFLIFTSGLILRETPSLSGLFGILLIVAGIFLITAREGHGFFLVRPLSAIFSDKGALMMLVVAFIYSITMNFTKIAVQNSNPATYLLISRALVSLGFLPIIHLWGEELTGTFRDHSRSLLPIGFFQAFSTLFQMMALKMTLASYVIALKRTTILFSIICGAIFFKEKNIREKLLGGSVIMGGVILIAFSGHL